MPTLGCFVRCHSRADTLEIVLQELLRYGTLPGLQTKIHVWADRPTWMVERVLGDYRDRLWGLTYSPWPLVGQRERFMEALELQRLRLAQTQCDWYGLFDDDRWLEPVGATTELPRVLASEDVDLWYANSIFLEDAADRFNPTRRHHAPLLWRVDPRDHFPTERMIQATANVHDTAIISGRTGTLQTPLLDYGTFKGEERAELYDRFAAAGKIDAYTRTYIQPAQLLKFPEAAVAEGLMPDMKWKDLWSERQKNPSGKAI